MSDETNSGDTVTRTMNGDTDMEESSEKSSPPKRPLCEMCLDVEHKYTCPGCGMRTCSLPCIRAHKERLSCSGERDKTAFVDMSQYKDLHLLSDYRFLEDAERSIYSNKATTLKRPKAFTSGSNQLTKRSKYLINAAQKRGIKLQMLPQFLSRNKNNSSFYTVKIDCIDWYIEWLFVTPLNVVKVKDQKVKETTKLLDAAGKFLVANEYPHLRKPLKIMDKTNLADCQFLIKVEGLPANRPRFYPLKPESLVSTNLMGHCITEHPIFHVVPACQGKNNYILLSKEDMTFMTEINARHMSRHFPELRLDKQDAEGQLLNPLSSVFVPSLPVKKEGPVVEVTPKELKKQVLTFQSRIYTPKPHQVQEPETSLIINSTKMENSEVPNLPEKDLGMKTPQQNGNLLDLKPELKEEFELANPQSNGESHKIENHTTLDQQQTSTEMVDARQAPSSPVVLDQKQMKSTGVSDCQQKEDPFQIPKPKSSLFRIP